MKSLKTNQGLLVLSYRHTFLFRGGAVLCRPLRHQVPQPGRGEQVFGLLRTMALGKRLCSRLGLQMLHCARCEGCEHKMHFQMQRIGRQYRNSFATQKRHFTACHGFLSAAQIRSLISWFCIENINTKAK